MTNSENEQAKPKRVHSRSSANTIMVTIPLPKIGETAELLVPRYGLTLLIDRSAVESEEDRRKRYTACGPTRSSDRNLHAARIGTGERKAKMLFATVCSENESSDAKIRSGARLDVPLEFVTCVGCRKVLTAEGVSLKEME
jgi:hypothetical protein